MEKQRPAWLRVIERVFLTLGLVLLGFYVLARIHGVVTLHAALRSFEEAQHVPEVKETAARLPSGDSLHTDYSLWSVCRESPEGKRAAVSLTSGTCWASS